MRKYFKEKTIPLTDLAIISPKPIEQKRKLLRRFASFVPDKTYIAIRTLAGGFFNWRLPMMDFERLPWEILEQKIRRLSDPGSIEINIQVGRALYSHTSGRDIWAAKMDGVALHISQDRKIDGDVGYYVVEKDRLFIPKIEPRRDAGFDATSASVYTSIVRAIYCFGDYENAEIDLLEFPEINRSGTRKVKVTGGQSLLHYDRTALTTMFSETYAIYRDVIREMNNELAQKLDDDQPDLPL